MYSLPQKKETETETNRERITPLFAYCILSSSRIHALTVTDENNNILAVYILHCSGAKLERSVVGYTGSNLTSFFCFWSVFCELFVCGIGLLSVRGIYACNWGEIKGCKVNRSFVFLELKELVWLY